MTLRFLSTDSSDLRVIFRVSVVVLLLCTLRIFDRRLSIVWEGKSCNGNSVTGYLYLTVHFYGFSQSGLIISMRQGLNKLVSISACLHARTIDLHLRVVCDCNNEVYNSLFSMDELRDAIFQSHNTATGPDDIHYQMLKHLPPNVSTIIFYRTNVFL